jgi:hypothetical protein
VTPRHTSEVSARSSRRKRALAYAVVYAGAGSLLMLLILGIAQMRSLAVGNAETLRTIKDCTTEGGECYEDSRKGTGEVIRVLNDFTTYVVACADRDGVQSVARIKACAIKKARKAQR